MPRKRYKQTEEHRRKVGDAIRGKKRPDMMGDTNPMKRPEVRKKFSESSKGRTGYWRGKKRPEMTGDKSPTKRPEVRNKMRKKHPSMMGDNNPAKRPDVRKKISESNKGRIVTKETRRKIGLKLKGNIPLE